MRRTAIIAAITCALVGCSSSTRSANVRMFDRPAANQMPTARNSNLLFDPTPGAVDPSSFVRSDWPSTPRKWSVTSEEVRWRETVYDHQGDGYGHRDHDRYHRVFRSDRRGRAKANK